MRRSWVTRFGSSLHQGTGDISDPFGHRTKGYGVLTHRNPVSPWSVGEMRLRFAERRAAGLLYQDPPRITLVPPDDGPIGFCGGLFL